MDLNTENQEIWTYPVYGYPFFSKTTLSSMLFYLLKDNFVWNRNRESSGLFNRLWFMCPLMFLICSFQKVKHGQRGEKGESATIVFVAGIESFLFHHSWPRLAPDLCCLPLIENVFCPSTQEEHFWVVCVLSLFFWPLKHRYPTSSNVIGFPPCYKA